MPVGTYSVDVTSAVNAWLANPASNMGLIFKPSGGNNGAGLYTSERTGGYSPKLSVTVRGVVPPSAQAWVNIALGALSLPGL